MPVRQAGEIGLQMNLLPVQQGARKYVPRQMCWQGAPAAAGTVDDAEDAVDPEAEQARGETYDDHAVCLPVCPTRSARPIGGDAKSFSQIDDPDQAAVVAKHAGPAATAARWPGERGREHDGDHGSGVGTGENRADAE